MALSFTVAILLVGGLGWLVDGWLHTRPLFAVVGAFAGGFAGFMSIYYRVKRDTEKKP
jgi:F0F1-type ATP synthase assembly protein I